MYVHLLISFKAFLESRGFREAAAVLGVSPQCCCLLSLFMSQHLIYFFSLDKPMKVSSAICCRRSAAFFTVSFSFLLSLGRLAAAAAAAPAAAAAAAAGACGAVSAVYSSDKASSSPSN